MSELSIVSILKNFFLLFKWGGEGGTKKSYSLVSQTKNSNNNSPMYIHDLETAVCCSQVCVDNHLMKNIGDRFIALLPWHSSVHCRCVVHGIVWCRLSCLTDTSPLWVLYFVCIPKVGACWQLWTLTGKASAMFWVFIFLSLSHTPEKDGTLQQLEPINRSSMLSHNFVSVSSSRVLSLLVRGLNVLILLCYVHFNGILYLRV